MAAKYSAENGKTRVLPIQTSALSADESEFVEVFTADPSSSSPLYRTKKVLMTEREARELDVKPKWIPVLEECSVECGGSKCNIDKSQLKSTALFLRLDQRELRLPRARPQGGNCAM